MTLRTVQCQRRIKFEKRIEKKKKIVLLLSSLWPSHKSVYAKGYAFIPITYLHITHRYAGGLCHHVEQLHFLVYEYNTYAHNFVL